jgi:dTDP-4-amino-4,6-dideoxygalactose transaminase
MLAPTQTTMPVNQPLLNGNQLKYLTECIETGWISSEGPFVRQLEEGNGAAHSPATRCVGGR